MQTGCSRRWFLGAAAYASCFGLGAPSHGWAQAGQRQSLADVETAARREGKFVWYDAIPREQAATVSDAFGKRHRGVTAEYVEVVAAQRISRILQESRAGGPTADVFTDYADVIMKLAEQELIQQSDWNALGVESGPEHAPNAHLLLTHSTPYVFLYNRDKVSGTDIPKSYADLLRPRWMGKIGLWATPAAFVSMSAKWSDNEVLDFVGKLAALKPRLYASPRALAEAVGAGEMEIAAFIPFNTIGPTISKGAPVEVTWLQPVSVSPVFGAIPKFGSNPNAGRLFLSWLVSPEGAAVWEDATGRGNPFVTGTKLSTLMAGKDTAILPIEKAVKESDRLNSFGATIQRTLQGR